MLLLVRAIFLDVDGTIIDHSEKLAPSVIDAVRGARAAGHLVFLCTGRARPEISHPSPTSGSTAPSRPAAATPSCAAS